MESSDRLQDAELAPAIGDRHGQRVHDPEDGDQHGDGNLYRRQRKPLIRDPEDVVLELAVGEHEHLTDPGVAAENLTLHIRWLRIR